MTHPGPEGSRRLSRQTGALPDSHAWMHVSDVLPTVLTAAGVSELAFGKDYVIPKPMDARLLPRVARAVALAAVNVFGGFLVTRRMLEMFKKKAPKTGAGK